MIRLQFAVRGIAVRHTNAGDTAGVCADEVVFAVTDHDGLCLFLRGEVQPFHGKANDVRLGLVIPLDVTAGDHLKILRQMEVLHNLQRKDLRL